MYVYSKMYPSYSLLCDFYKTSDCYDIAVFCTIMSCLTWYVHSRFNFLDKCRLPLQSSNWLQRNSFSWTKDPNGLETFARTCFNRTTYFAINAIKQCIFYIIVKRLHVKVSTRYWSVVKESDVKQTKSISNS